MLLQRLLQLISIVGLGSAVAGFFEWAGVLVAAAIAWILLHLDIA